LKGGNNTYGYVSGNPLMNVDPKGLLKWTGTFDIKAGGIGKLGGLRGTFTLESECDIDGYQGFATVVGYAGSLGIGVPMSQIRGSIEFEDGHIRAEPYGFWGRFTVDSIGVQIGPIGLSRTNIYLGDAVATKIDAAGFDAGISFGVTGRSEVISADRRKTCKCEYKP
jgi:hypothetical protein